MKKIFTLVLISLCISNWSNAQDLTFDFETWTTVGTAGFNQPNPVNVFGDPNSFARGWSAYSPTLLPTCAKVTPGQLSSSACSIATVKADLSAIGYGVKYLLGNLKTGATTTGGNYRVIPNTTKFDQLSVYYKYTPSAAGDTAVVIAELYAADSTVLASVNQQITASTTTFTLLNAKFVYTDYSTPVASYGIYISPTKSTPTSFYLASSSKLGSTLIIDNLKLYGTATAVNPVYDNSNKYAYTIGQGKILVVRDAENSIIDIYSATGQKVSTHKVSANGENISIAGLNNGIYLYSIKLKDGSLVSGKFLK